MSHLEKTEKSCSDKNEAQDALRASGSAGGERWSPALVKARLEREDGGIRDRWIYLHLAIISTLLFVVPIFFLDICGGDETRVAGIAAEMALDGDWLTPKLNGTPFLEYPPLFYAAVAASFRIFGITAFAAKLPTALSAVAGVLLFYAMLRILRRNKCESFAGAFILATGLQFLTNAFDCRVDIALTSCCILVWTGFAAMEFSGRGAARRTVGMVMIAAGLAGSLLTKNLTGLAITLPGMGCALLFRDLAERRFSFAAYCRLAGAVLLGVLPYALYLWLMYKTAGVDTVKTILLYNNFGRFSGSVADHSSPWWGYLVSLPETFPPYLPLLLGGIFLQLRDVWKRRSGYGILSLTLLVIPFAVLSAASNKRQVYLLPLAAPASMLAATTLPHVIYYCRRLFGDKAMRMVRRRSGIIVYTAAVLLALITGAALRQISHRKSFAPVFAAAEAQLRAIPGSRLVLVQPNERLLGAAVFYRHAVVPQLGKWAELKSGDVALAPAGSQLPPELPKGWTVRRFRKAKLILVSRER